MIRVNLKSSQRKGTHYTQEKVENGSKFFPGHYLGEETGNNFFRKKGQKKSIHLAFYTPQKHLLKMKAK